MNNEVIGLGLGVDEAESRFKDTLVLNKASSCLKTPWIIAIIVLVICIVGIYNVAVFFVIVLCSAYIIITTLSYKVRFSDASNQLLFRFGKN